LYVLSKDLFFTILLSIAVAFPVSWLLMEQCLGNFLFRVSHGVFLSVAAPGITIVVALLAVMYYAIKSVFIQPADVLKQE